MPPSAFNVSDFKWFPENLRRGQWCWVLPVALVFIVGCFPQNEEVLSRPPESWSSRDCLTVLESATRNNLGDIESPNIKIIATMLSPSVIIAGHRRGIILDRQGPRHLLQPTPPLEQSGNLADSDYIASIDAVIEEEAGIYREWQTGKYVDARGNYVRSYAQIDSLTFFISLENRSWPCIPAMMNIGGAPMRPILSPLDYPCYVPDISDLESRIYLLNDQNKFIRPIVVWGRGEEFLMRPENLVVKFHIGKEDYHFLEHSDNLRLLFTGFDKKRIFLEYPVALVR